MGSRAGIIYRTTSLLGGLTAGGAVAVKNHAGAAGFGNEFIVFVFYDAFDVGSGFAALDDDSFGSKFGSPNGAEKIYFELHGGEGLACFESASEGYAHGGVRNVAQNSTMERAHGVGVLRARLQSGDGTACGDFRDLKANQVGDGHLDGGGWRSKGRLGRGR